MHILFTHQRCKNPDFCMNFRPECKLPDGIAAQPPPPPSPWIYRLVRGHKLCLSPCLRPPVKAGILVARRALRRRG